MGILQPWHSWNEHVMHYPPSFSTPMKTCLWERRTYFVVGMRYITWPEFTEKQKWFCRTTVGFMFAFLLLWLAGNSVAWAEWLPVSVWCYLSANARFSCQEIKPTQYTFIAKNDVKVFLLCFIYLFFQNRISTVSLLCQDLLLLFLFRQDQRDFVLLGIMYVASARNSTVLLCADLLSRCFLQQVGNLVNLRCPMHKLCLWLPQRTCTLQVLSYKTLTLFGQQGNRVFCFTWKYTNLSHYKLFICLAWDRVRSTRSFVACFFGIFPLQG